MTKYKTIQNLKTGKDEFSFNATLLEVGENVIQNSNGKDYKILTLDDLLNRFLVICFEGFFVS
jgi:hypothetical protein